MAPAEGRNAQNTLIAITLAVMLKIKILASSQLCCLPSIAFQFHEPQKFMFYFREIIVCRARFELDKIKKIINHELKHVYHIGWKSKSHKMLLTLLLCKAPLKCILKVCSLDLLLSKHLTITKVAFIVYSYLFMRGNNISFSC